MNGKVTVRLFYSSPCSGGCCGCGPNKDVAALELVAGKLAKKFGEERLEFEAYPVLDYKKSFLLRQKPWKKMQQSNLRYDKKFPFLRKAAGPTGNALPVVSVDETVLAQGAVPAYPELEKEVAKRLKVI